MPDWFPATVAQAVAFVPLRITFLIVVALLARFVIHRVINRVVRRTIEQQKTARYRAAKILREATTITKRRDQRVSALGSMARSIVTVVLLLTTSMMVLSELGFEIVTLLAGTSIVAVTLAFGLQNVIKDLISGIFMLVEDQLGVGDWVDLERASGTVEEVGLRVTQLRDPEGVVWYVRNGEVLRVGNFSQGGPGQPPPGEDSPKTAEANQATDD